MKFTLDLLPGTYAICRPTPDSPLPDWAKPNRQLIDDYCYWFHNWA